VIYVPNLPDQLSHSSNRRYFTQGFKLNVSNRNLSTPASSVSKKS